MKVALCISGMSRSFKATSESVQRHIIDRYNPDVFISTWKPDFADARYPDTDPPEELIDLYRPLKFDIELFNKAREQSFATNQFSTRADWNGAAVVRMLPMFYKIYLANLHKTMFERENKLEYDVVIRCRSDLLFRSPLELVPPEDNAIYFPEHNSQNGVNDQFWFCSSKISNDICSLYLDIPFLWHQGIIIHGEALLHAAAAVMGIRAIPFKLDYDILR